MSTTESKVRTYFRAKAKQLRVLAETAICDHTSLVGSCREEFQRMYLRELLPKRYSVGRGMIYGPLHRSQEVDIVLWDELNYGSLPTGDHSFYFAESVRVALECKSTWSSKEMEDVLRKTTSVRNIWSPYGATLADDVRALEEKIEAVVDGRSYEGALIVRHHIATASIFLNGGGEFGPGYLEANAAIAVDDAWPDLLLLLQPGKVVIKSYMGTGGLAGQGSLDFYDLDEDALMVFTSGLLTALEERSVLTEPSSRLAVYTPELAQIEPTNRVAFPLTRPPAQRTAFWT